MRPNTIGLYLHIPFCAQKCAYCDFYSLSAADSALMDEYLAALLTHMKETAEFTGRKSGKNGGWAVDTVYIGGGTPSYFGVKRLRKLLAAVHSLWNLSTTVEITLEANPDSVDLKSLKKLRRAGVNRLSLGVQAIQPELLQALGRIHTAEQAADAVRDAHKAGFDNISVDLMYGLPGQTAEMLHESLQAVLTWDIQHLSVYGLKLEPGTPLCEAKPELPDDEAQYAQYLATVNFLAKQDFAQYEISNFAKGGRVSRHNLKYWQLEPYIGLGPAAHSDFGERRYGNVRDIRAYIDGVTKGGAVIAEMDVIDKFERSGEYVMLGLRTTRGISGNDFTRMYKVSFDPLERKLERLAKYGLAELVGDRWRLTPQGFMVSNRILSELLGTIIE